VDAHGLLDELDLLVAQVSREALPVVVGRLDGARAQAWVRMQASGPAPPEPTPREDEMLLTPEQASQIAGVPKTRIYSWARGKRWACRPSRKCLRIYERKFRRWLEARSS